MVAGSMVPADRMIDGVAPSAVHIGELRARKLVKKNRPNSYRSPTDNPALRSPSIRSSMGASIFKVRQNSP